MFIEEIEEFSQTTLYTKGRKFTNFDLEKARKRYIETGKYGEELVNKYLSELKNQNKITDFSWINQSKESYAPYDFEIKNQEQLVYVDVKSSSYRFEQKMFFSKNEIEFVGQIQENYQIYRVFDISNEQQASLKICDNSKSLFSTLNTKIDCFSSDISSFACIGQLSVAISPNHKQLQFNDDILLYIE